MSANKAEEFFKPIGSRAEEADALPDDDPSGPQTQVEQEEDGPIKEVESLCMKCHEQGVTRMMLTAIPYFREIVIYSFRCEHCGETNNEIQSAGKIQDYGSQYTAKILTRADTDRQVVKSSNCVVFIPELELNIPAQRGQLTTVEGLLRDVRLDLESGQVLRRITDPVTAEKIDALIAKINGCLGVDTNGEKIEGEEIKPFTVKLDDPSGNSWIEFMESMSDPKWSMKTYPRTREQNELLGLDADAEKGDKSVAIHAIEKPTEAELEQIRHEGEGAGAEEKERLANEEVFIFPGTCSSCHAPLDTLMKKVVIPYFKDVLIMSTNCERCGYRDNEIKSGGAISEQGRRITLKVESAEDLARDILKSETCGMEIPEIELVLQPGTLGGRFTTLEGILAQVYDELSEKAFAGDSADTKGDRQAFTTFLGRLKEAMEVQKPYTIILDDPLANSYLQNLYAPDPDPNMEITMYDRSWEENEDLGLNDIKVEDYEEGHAADVAKAKAEAETKTNVGAVNVS